MRYALLILTLVLSGCAVSKPKDVYTEEHLKKAYEAGYKDGSKKGYELGYKDGVDEVIDAVETLIQKECDDGGVIQSKGNRYYCGRVQEF